MTGTVTVACKLPHGLHLDLPDRPRITIAGIGVPVGVVPQQMLYAGFALTPNVDEEFFDAWLERNADSDVVRKGLVFAQPKMQDARAEAKEKQDQRTGLEPMDPDKPSPGIERVGVAS